MFFQNMQQKEPGGRGVVLSRQRRRRDCTRRFCLLKQRGLKMEVHAFCSTSTFNSPNISLMVAMCASNITISSSMSVYACDDANKTNYYATHLHIFLLKRVHSPRSGSLCCSEHCLLLSYLACTGRMTKESKNQNQCGTRPSWRFSST